MNRSPLTQHPRLFFLLVFLCLGCLPGFRGRAHAQAEETGAGSNVKIQNGRISVSAKDIPLDLLCKDIEEKSGVRFRIQDALLTDKLSIELRDLPLLKGVKRLLVHMNYMLYFDQRNRLSEVFIVGRVEHYTPPVSRRPPPRRGAVRTRRLPNRPLR
jgi:hypothetical protein